MKAFGLIGMLAGGFIVGSMYMRGGPQGSGAYLNGQYMALGFGILLLIGGAIAMFKSE